MDVFSHGCFLKSLFQEDFENLMKDLMTTLCNFLIG